MALILLFIYAFPYLWLGRKVHISIHDNLNQINMLGIFDARCSATLFPGEEVREYTLPGTADIFHLVHMKLDKLFFLKDYFNGYVINELLHRLLAGLGFFLLLKLYLWKNTSDLIRLFVSFSYIILPFWPPGCLSVSGIPLVILGLLNLYRGKWILSSFLIIILYAAYSNFFLTGIYVLFMVLVFLILALLKRKSWLNLAMLLLCYILVSFITHLPVFLNEFFLRIPTNRVVQDLTASGIIPVLKSAFFLLVRSHLLSHSYHTWLILPICLLGIVLSFCQKLGSKTLWIILFGSILIFNTFIFSLFHYRDFYQLYQRIGIGYNFSRIYVLNTPLWYLLWALCLGVLHEQIKNKQLLNVLLISLIILQILINLYFHYHRTFLEGPSFNRFVSRQQFLDLREHLDAGDPDYRIGCIGFYPAVANYNGFRTVDSFSAYYPLQYKERFYKIIARELQHNEELHEYYRRRGSALFLFDDRIGFNYSDQDYIRQQIPEIHCELDVAEMVSLGVRYLFSTARISNAAAMNLELASRSTAPEYYYRLFIYRILQE